MMKEVITRRKFLEWGAVLGGSIIWNRGVEVNADWLSAEESKEIVLPVPVYRQKKKLTCEVAAGRMTTEFFRVSSLAGFPDVEDYLLSKIGFHENPHKGFLGNYDGIPDGYGVYAGPLAFALRTLDLVAVAKYDLPYEELAREIFAGRPVIVWVSQGDKPAVIEKDEEGEYFSLIDGEHAVVVAGCRRVNGRTFFLVNDPSWSLPEGKQAYWAEKLPRWRDDRRGDFGGMAVVVYGKRGYAVPDYRYTLKPAEWENFREQKEKTAVRGIYYRGPAVSEIALTTDDGYSLESLTKTCDFVEKFHLPLSLFLIGRLYWDGRYKEIFKRALDLGCELQNHTWLHKDLVKLQKEEGMEAVKKEIGLAQEAILQFTGGKGKSGKYFRPPYGSVNSEIVQAAAEMGMETVLWSATSGGTARKEDGSLIDPWQILLNLASVGKGEIILTHANWNDVAALPDLREKIFIPRMLKPVLLSELLV